MKLLLLIPSLMISTLRAEETVIFLEEFTGGAYDNDGWVTWHAPWGSYPTINLDGGSARLSIATRNGSCGIAILVDISAHSGKTMTLEGIWGGTATGEAWVEIMMFQSASSVMTDLSSANFLTFDAPALTDIAIKHDSFGLPDAVWSPQTFAADAANNGPTAGFGGLTQIATNPYLVLAFKVGRDGTIVGLDNLRLTVPADPGVDVVLAEVGFNGASFEVTASGMDPARTYRLRRSLNGQSFTDIGAPVTGSSTHLFLDPSPPAGQTALYQVWAEPAP